ncbi:hypothetical protein ZHAS_00008041 [Anopheles sinensis]|uniref:Uncharacterized protein n=1 Tax=Anopheles sinensis TaxID=74873 RepID=A0A084VRA6_ANOSI|nr:hypothetical protein ZHAS_00008041 [Anopheles sinensis]
MHASGECSLLVLGGGRCQTTFSDSFSRHDVARMPQPSRLGCGLQDTMHVGLLGFGHDSFEKKQH